MLTKADIEKLRSEYTVESGDVRQLIEVIDAMRAFIQNIAESYSEEKPVENYDEFDEFEYQAAYDQWIDASRAREFLAALDAGMLEETGSDETTGDIPF